MGLMVSFPPVTINRVYISKGDHYLMGKFTYLSKNLDIWVIQEMNSFISLVERGEVGIFVIH